VSVGTRLPHTDHLGPSANAVREKAQTHYLYYSTLLQESSRDSFPSASARLNVTL